MKTFYLVPIFALILGACTTASTVIPTATPIPWACDDGPNDIVIAAEAAYKNGNEAIAWQLAAHGELLCVDNPDKFAQAATLRKSLDPNPQDALPGIIELGDFSLFMVCMGEGSPTVIFENGSLADATWTWKDVQPAISTTTRTCRYDRRGVGLSPSDVDVERTTQDQVNDLIVLLETAGIEPPYVLVGHSLAGLNILLFTAQNPDWVAGIVLADTLHPRWPERVAVADPLFDIGVNEIDVDTSVAQTVYITNLGDVPLAVIGPGDDFVYNRVQVPFNEEAFQVWIELQHEYASYSSHSRYISGEDAGHLVPQNRPDIVIRAILWVLGRQE